MLLPLLLAAAQTADPVAVAADPPPVAEKDPNEIVIIGGRNPARIGVDRFRDAQKAFAKYRERYAPEATLFFKLEPAKAGDERPIRLTLEGRGRSVPVTADAQGRFVLPAFTDDDWRLVSDRPEAAFRISALVLSPTSRVGDWRLGDLQLQCRVSWQLIRSEENLLVAGLFDAAGGCTSSRIGIYYRLPAPIVSARIAEGARSEAVPVARQSIRLPTYRKEYGNEARVTVMFADPS